MQHQSRPPPSSSLPPIRHLDYTRATTRQVQVLWFVAFLTWFPARCDERASPMFYMLVQEDMYMAYVNSEAQIREHSIVDLEYLANIVGQDI